MTYVPSRPIPSASTGAWLREAWKLPAKDRSVETLRGIAVILLVAGHVVGADATNAMQVPDDSAWRLIYLAFEDIRMPLFTIISGYLYGLRPISSTAGYRGLLRGKVRRLLLPMVVVSTLVFWLKLVTPGTNKKPDIHDFWRPYFFLFDHMWFLQAIFTVFVIVAALSLLPVVLYRRSTWVAVTAASFLPYVFVTVPGDWNIFSISGTFRLLPFFLVGYGFSFFGLGKVWRGWVMLFVAVFAIAYSLRLVDLATGAALHGVPDRALGVAVGVPAVALLFWARGHLANHFLAWIGGFSFGIYLLHWFTYSAARIGLRAVGVDNDFVTFGAGLLAGLALPILFQLLTRRMPTIRLVLLGEKRPRRSRGDALVHEEPAGGGRAVAQRP